MSIKKVDRPIPDGPQTLFTPKTLWIGTDPVALDAAKGVGDADLGRIKLEKIS